jgi:predicted NBD/HSP70 family sugar kinase
MNLLSWADYCQGVAVETDRELPIRQGSLRAHNLGLVLRHVANTPSAVSRADVAAATGLTRATVSSLVEELIAGRLLAEVGAPRRSGAGRPAVGLRLADHGPAGLGLEINVDYLAACLVDLTGAVRQHEVRYADQRGRRAERVLDDVASLAADFVRSAEDHGVTVAGSALAVPGLVTDDGLVRRAPNLGWTDVDVRSALRRRNLELYTVDNEANLAALGELHAWAQARPSFAYVSGEIGVGGGIVLDGRLFRGGRGFGGELGHITVTPDGPACRCGSRGCLETYANQEALIRDAGIDPGPQAVAELAARAAAGEPRCVQALERAGTTLGVALSTVVNLFDLEAIVLGGAYAALTPWLAPAVNRELSQRVLTAAWAPVSVRGSVLNAAATIVGAGSLVVRAIVDAPTSWLSRDTG